MVRDTKSRPHVLGAMAAFVLLGLMIALAAVPGRAGAQQPQDLGAVRAQEFTRLPIAVPEFEPTGGRKFEQAVLSEVVANDLRLSGFFSLPANPAFVAEVNRADRQKGQIDYPEWRRLGVYYVVKGNYDLQGDKLTAEVRTYDVVAGTLIFGRRYEFPQQRYRELAHQASDDIMERVTTIPGVANTKIIFVGEVPGTGKPSKEIFVMDADGQNLRQLTSDANLAATPAWGANATEVYYTTYKDFNPDLAGIFLDRSYNWWISRRPGFNLSPAWSQKRRLIALTLTKDGNSEIYTMNREGKNPKRLTHEKAIDSSPDWNPTGDQIVFTSDRTGSPQIHIMDESGVNPRRLTFNGNYSDGARWSPLGDKIAFASRVDGVFQIFTINPNGTDLRQLTFGNANSEDPSWAPNGWVLSYTSDRSGRKQIYTMLVDGTDIAHLRTSQAAHSAEWSPMLQ